MEKIDDSIKKLRNFKRAFVPLRWFRRSFLNRGSNREDIEIKEFFGESGGGGRKIKIFTGWR